MNRWLIGVVVLIILAGTGVWVAFGRTDPSTVVVGAGSVTLQGDVATATLYSPNSDDSKTGVATRQYVDVIFVHGVTATLPDLPPDQFYAGWLVSAADPTHPLPTGKFIKDAGNWSLSFSSPTDESSYDGVLVTVQTGENQAPGATILTGSFLK